MTLLGVLALLWAANKATEATETKVALAFFSAAAIIGAAVAGTWSWLTWGPRQVAQARRPATRREARRVTFGIGAGAGGAGLVLATLSESLQATLFGFMGGFLLAAMISYAVAVATGAARRHRA